MPSVADYVSRIVLDTKGASRDLNRFDSAAVKASDKLEKGFTRAGKSISRVGDRIRGVGDKLSSSQFNNIRLKGAAVFGAGTLAANTAASAASDLGESINAVNVVFGEGAKNILDFSNQAAKSVGLSAEAFNSLSTQTGALLGATGEPMGEMADLTIDLTKRAADLASVFNTDVNDAMSAINQAIRGETEAIRRYAGDVTDATLQEFLFSKGVKTKISALTQQEKILLRTEVILAQTAKVEGDFLNTSDDLANQTRINTARFKDLTAQLGRRVLPIKLKLVTILSKVLDRFDNLTEGQKTWVVGLAAGATAIGGLIAVVGPALTGIGLMVLAVGKAVGAFRLLGVLLRANPLGILITALISVAYYFREDIVAALKTFKKWAGEVIDDVTEFFSDFKTSIKGIPDFLGKMWDQGIEAVKEFLEPLMPLIEFFDTALTVAVEKFVTFFKDKFSFITGLVDGLKSGLDKVKDALTFGDGTNVVVPVNGPAGAGGAFRSRAAQLKGSASSASRLGPVTPGPVSNQSNNSEQTIINQEITVNGAGNPPAVANEVLRSTPLHPRFRKG